MSWTQKRAALHEAIQRDAAPSDEPGAVLTGWVLIAEFLDTEGAKWLAMRSGPEELTAWAREGFLHRALYDDSWERDAWADEED